MQPSAATPLGSLPTTSPVKIRHVNKVNNPLLMSGGVLVALVVAVLIGIWQAGVIKDILQDKKIQANAQPVDAGFGPDSRCRSRYKVMTSCVVHIRYQGQQVKKNFGFFDFGSRSYTVTAMGSPDVPGVVTLDLAMEKVTSRLAFSAVFILIGLVCAFAAVNGLLRRLPRAFKATAALNDPANQPLQVLALPLNGEGDKYLYDGEEVAYNFGQKAPWVVQDSAGRVHILAVAPKQGGVPAVLDAALETLGGLSPDGRNAVRQAVLARLEQEGGWQVLG